MLMFEWFENLYLKSYGRLVMKILSHFIPHTLDEYELDEDPNALIFISTLEDGRLGARIFRPPNPLTEPKKKVKIESTYKETKVSPGPKHKHDSKTLDNISLIYAQRNMDLVDIR